MTEQELRLYRSGFTGHGPEKLRLTKTEIQPALQGEIEAAIADGFVTFLSGMARGEAIHRPYEGVEKCWAHERQELYAHVMRQADFTQFIRPHFDSAPDPFIAFQNDYKIHPRHASHKEAAPGGYFSFMARTICNSACF